LRGFTKVSMGVLLIFEGVANVLEPLLNPGADIVEERHLRVGNQSEMLSSRVKFSLISRGLIDQDVVLR
jgi:hypothetical protein